MNFLVSTFPFLKEKMKQITERVREREYKIFLSVSHTHIRGSLLINIIMHTLIL
jgi:hypothetical protein